jgi:protein-S-isoprenylcysteine O-methyltransferase Ste14
MPGEWSVAATAVMVLVHLAIPGPRLIPAPYRYGGAALIVAGVALGAWAVRLFRRGRTTLKLHKSPRALVRSGPYRFSRHPMYLALMLLLAGAAALLGSLSPWAIVLAFFLLVARPAALADERSMEEAFGEEYRQYAGEARRWL